MDHDTPLQLVVRLRQLSRTAHKSKLTLTLKLKLLLAILPRHLFIFMLLAFCELLSHLSILAHWVLFLLKGGR